MCDPPSEVMFFILSQSTVLFSWMDQGLGNNSTIRGEPTFLLVDFEFSPRPMALLESSLCQRIGQGTQDSLGFMILGDTVKGEFLETLSHLK